MEEAADTCNEAPMDMATEMATAVISIAAETAGATRFETIERNENGQRRRRSEDPAAPSDWKSRMERTIRQQAQDLTQLHRTVGHLANLWEVWAAREEAQWQGMMGWMQEREQKWDARHEDDKLWGAGITNMIAKVMKGVAPGQEVRETDREKTARMDGGVLEASQHADTTREVGHDQRQQPQQQPKPKLQLKLQPKPQPAPKPKSTPTPPRWWETVPPRAQWQSPGPASTSGPSMADRRLVLRRDESIPRPNMMDEEIVSAVNRALFQQQPPAHVQIMNARRNARGTIPAITHQNATAEMALLSRVIIIKTARTFGKGIIDVEGNESWERLKIHTIPLVRYIGKGTKGHQKMREEIQAENEGVTIPARVRWLSNPRTIKEREQRGDIKASSVVFMVKGKKVAQRLVSKGVSAAGVRYKVEPYTNAGPDSLCELCCWWGHIESKCNHQLKCSYCAGPR